MKYLSDMQKLLKSILRNIVYLQTDIKHISMKQSEILTKLQEERETTAKLPRPSKLVDEFTFPIHEIDYLNLIEEKINVDDDIRFHLV